VHLVGSVMASDDLDGHERIHRHDGAAAGAFAHFAFLSADTTAQ
jgi:hypothetical protein